MHTSYQVIGMMLLQYRTGYQLLASFYSPQDKTCFGEGPIIAAWKYLAARDLPTQPSLDEIKTIARDCIINVFYFYTTISPTGKDTLFTWKFRDGSPDDVASAGAEPTSAP